MGSNFQLPKPTPNTSQNTPRPARKERTPIPKRRAIGDEFPPLPTTLKMYLATVKVGSIHGSEDVNKLYSNVRRSCAIPFHPICLADDPSGLEGYIDVIYPPFSLPGFWNKMFLFSPAIPSGEVLYLDIDQAPVGDITNLVEACRAAKQPMAGSSNAIQSIGTRFSSSWLNSTWLYFQSPELVSLYEDFIANPPNFLDNPELEPHFSWNQTQDLFFLEESILGAVKSFRFQPVR